MSYDFGSPLDGSAASHTTCWACMSNLAIPTANGVQAPMFKVSLHFALSVEQGLLY